MGKSKLYIFIMLSSLCLLVKCTRHSETYADLERIDSLLYREQIDSADKILRDITPQCPQDSAYYYILRTQTDYRLSHTNTTFDGINYSIDYYTHNHDAQKLANAFYYKALVYILHDTITKDMITLLKKAEELTEGLDDDDLKYKICSALVFANSAAADQNESLKYAKKEYYYSKKTDNEKDIAYALLTLSSIYRMLGQPDSVQYYINKCKNLVQLVNDKDKMFVYNLLGENAMQYDLKTAKEYFKTALRYYKQTMPYRNLARVYFMEQDAATAEKYCDSALMRAWYALKLEIFSELTNQYYNDRNLEKLKSTADRIIATHKQQTEQDRTQFIISMQKKFDFEKQQIEYERNIYTCIAIITMLIAATIYIYQRHKRAVQMAKQAELESENKNLQLLNELATLKQKITDYEANRTKDDNRNKDEYEASKRQVSKMIDIGRKIYEKINDAQSIANDKENWILFVYYYKDIHPRKAKTALEAYKGLSTDETVFILIDNAIQKTDIEISSILDISQTTVRTRRTKLKEKIG